MNPQLGFQTIVKGVGQTLRPLGFRRKGNIMRWIERDSCALIGFQRSVANSNDEVRFTVNVAIIHGPLIELESTSLQAATAAHAHLGWRLGELMPICSDKWWTIVGDTEILGLESEIRSAVLDYGVPCLRRYLDTRETVSLWESGRSPGLTKVQRARYLARLKTFNASRS